MTRRIGVSGLVLLLGFLLQTASPAGSNRLIEFEIKDQFDRVHTDADLRGRIILVFGSDRKGSRFNGAWSRALRESIESGSQVVAVLDVADLRGVPFFVKGSVKKKFPRDPAKRVLLDWKGAFAKAYEFEKDACNILLLDGTGRVVRRTAQTALNPKIVSEFVREIERHEAKLSD